MNKKTNILKMLIVAVIFSLICNNTVNAQEITSIFFKSNQAEKNGKLYVELSAKDLEETTKITGYFGNGRGEYLSIDLVDYLSPNPYFVMNSRMEPGDTYTMTMLSIESNNNRTTYLMSSSSNGVNPNLHPNGKNIVTIKGVLDELKLIGNSEVEPDSKMTLKLETNVNDNNFSITVRNKYNRLNSAVFYLHKIGDNTYEFDLSKGSDKLSDGQYYISEVFMNDKDTKKTYYFSTYTKGNDIFPLIYNVEFTIKSSTQPEEPENNEETIQEQELLKSITIKNTIAKLNQKVDVAIDTNKKLVSATLDFSNDNENLTVNIDDLNSSNPYFIVPITTVEGKYNLDYITLKDIDGKEYQYTSKESYGKIKYFNFDIILTIEKENESSKNLNIDNTKITPEVIDIIKESEKDAIIEINANDNPIISKELFDAIKGTDRTIIIKNKNLEWTFNGKDIKTSKQINTTTNIYDIKKEGDISNKVNTGLVISFSNNEDLPGKCMIKIYNSELLSKSLNKSNANIFYYNEQEKKFEIVKTNVEYNNKGYYEFYISHNSKYIITTDTINNKYILSTNNATNNNIKMIAIICSISIVVLSLMIVIIKKTKKHN